MDYIKDAIDYLINFDNLKNALENLKCKIVEAQLELKTVKELKYSDMPKGGGSAEPDDKVINLMYTIEKSKVEYKITKKKVDNIQRVIDNLPSKDKKLINVYYIQGIRGESLLKELCCSESEMYRDKRKAIRVLAINIHGIKAID